MTSPNVDTFKYNGYGEMSQAVVGGVTTNYTYYADGLRRTKTTNGVTTVHMWDGDNIIADLDGNYALKTGYARANDLSTMYNADGDEWYYIMSDRGDTIQMYNDTTETNYLYDAYGNQQTESTTDINPFRYCGEYYDAETGFTYLRARYYDPTTGRFISEDPIRDGLNWYAYCENNPVMFVDPWGLWKEGDEKLPYLVNYIINGADGKTGGLTAKWNEAQTESEKSRIATVANMLRCENVDYDLSKTSNVLLLLDKNGANVLGVSMGHMAVMIQNSEGQGIYFSYAAEDTMPIDGGMLNMDILSKEEMDAFLKTGNLYCTYASNGTLMTCNYTDYISINVSRDAGNSMIGKGIDYFWNPGTYVFVGHQCDNVASSIMEAGKKGYMVQLTPKISFNRAIAHFNAEESEFGQ